MSSEAITQNDLREILSRSIGSTPSEFRKLLWVNSNPTATFAPQTVNVDLADYDDVEIIFRHDWQTDWRMDSRTSVGKVGAITNARPDSFLSQERQFTTTNTGITFTDCKLGTSAQIFNDHSIPIYIYGIKYERVAPPQVDASDYVVEQGANYRKWDSGTMEQWGVEATATSSNHAVSFPKAFISTNYIVVGTNTSGTQANFMTSNTSASSFYVYPSASTKLFWIAIGKWK